MNNSTKLNSLPIVEDDVVFLLDNDNKKIKLGTVIDAQVDNSTSKNSKSGEISVQWHSNFKRQNVPVSEVKLFENRCEIGSSICSLKGKDKYGICTGKRTVATCVVHEDNSGDQQNKYLLEVDAERLKIFSNISFDLCFFKNAIYEVSDINYSFKLNYKNKLNVEIISTRRNFLKKFIVIDDKYNKQLMKDFKLNDFNLLTRTPLSFDELIGKLVTVKLGELLKFRHNLDFKLFLELISLSEGDNDVVNTNVKDCDQNEKNELASNDEKENKPNLFINHLKNNKSENDNVGKKIKLSVSDIKVNELVLNCIKDFNGSDDQDFKTEKVSGNQLDKIKFFKLDGKHVELGSRWKLELNENDKLVDFEQYQKHLNKSMKAKLANLPNKLQQDLNDYNVEVNECFENELKETAKQPNGEETNDQQSKDDKMDECESALDDVFSNVVQIDDITKHMSKDELRNNNLTMLSRYRRSRGSNSRNGSLNTRQNSDRLLNSSFRKVKLGSSADNSQEFDINDLDKEPLLNTPCEKHIDGNAEQSKVRTVLVDVLYTNRFIDVQWQDNTIETNIPLSHVTEEIDNLLNKYYPGNFVDYTGELTDGLELPTYGVIQKIKQSSNLAEVKWFVESDSNSMANQNDDDENNNQNKTKTWTTFESLFNLRASCIHFHLGDVVVDQNLITNFSKMNIEEMPKLIGTINEIHVDGRALCEWIDGSKSKKKLVELVSFFDVDFSVYNSDEDDSYLTMNSNSSSSVEKASYPSDLNDMISFEIENEKFTNLHKFNKYKFECIFNFKSTVDEIKFKEKWLNKLEKISEFIVEFKQLLMAQLSSQGFHNESNHSKDKKIIELTFEIIECYYEKIKNNIDHFSLKDKSYFFDFYLQMVQSLNNWLNVIQSSYEYLFFMFSEKAEYKNLNDSILNNSPYEPINTKQKASNKPTLMKELIDGLREIGFVKDDEDDDDDVCNQNTFLQEKEKSLIDLINKFNSEVMKKVNFVQANNEGSNEPKETTLNTPSTKSNPANDSAESDSSKEDDFKLCFKKLDCISIEDNKIKHEYMKSSVANSKKSSIRKVNLNTLQKELNLLRTSLPDSGIYFRTFEERLDLLSLMIEGPKNTVYENHLFLFDLRISENLNEPPECFYISFGKHQINPNLYKDGNVCLSLLNTFFSRKEEERWQPNRSSLLQLALSLQALVLNSNPFFNEADFDVYNNTEEGLKKAKSYNEHVIVSIIDYSIEIMRKKDDSAFKNEIQKHYEQNAYTIYKRYYDFIFISMNWNIKMKQIKENGTLSDFEKDDQFRKMVENEYPQFAIPSFTLMPCSEGFCLSLAKNLKSFVTFFEQHLPKSEIEVMDKQIADLISLIKV